VGGQRRGFTLIELLVTISIISLLMGIMLPSLGKIRRHALAIQSMNNQKQVTSGVNFFAADNHDRYPESIATVGFGDNWNWTDPTKLTGNRRRAPGVYRAMSEYLRSYIPNARTMYCPNAPQRYAFLQQAWDAGESWDYPNDDVLAEDPVGGTYCFYWNYVGYIGGRRLVFRGPQGPASSGQFSKLLVTDYYGYDHWRSPWSHSSCEKFDGARITPETWLLSAYWSREGDPDKPPEIKLRAGYTDGHVETYSPSSVLPMKVAITSDGRTPYPDGVGPGVFYLPMGALQ
jgi:prepilin-type N-terminal cleavage/methylation domain-containing protein